MSWVINLLVLLAFLFIVLQLGDLNEKYHRLNEKYKQLLDVLETKR